MAELIGQGGRIGAALLLMGAATMAMDVYSATNSSPWTAYKFANDQRSVDALWRYVRHAVVVTILVTILAATVARSLFPLVGAVLGGGYMLWLYADAVKRGRAEGSTPWEQQ